VPHFRNRFYYLATNNVLYSRVNKTSEDLINNLALEDLNKNKFFSVYIHMYIQYLPVIDLEGVRGVQIHPPLAASNVLLRT